MIMTSIYYNKTYIIINKYEGLTRLFDVEHHKEVDLFNAVQGNYNNHYVNSILTLNLLILVIFTLFVL